MRQYVLWLLMVGSAFTNAMEEKRLVTGKLADQNRPWIAAINNEYTLYNLVTIDLNFLKEAILAGINVNAYDCASHSSGQLLFFMFIGAIDYYLADSHETTEEVIDLMMQNGLNIHYRDKYGLTVLHKLMNKKEYPFWEKFINFGADVNGQDNQGNTPLHCILKSEESDVNTMDCIKKLLVYGADVHVKNKLQQTPLHEALRMSNLNLCKEIVPLLLARGACVDCKDVFGMNAYNHIDNRTNNDDVFILRNMLKDEASLCNAQSELFKKKFGGNIFNALKSREYKGPFTNLLTFIVKKCDCKK